LFSALPPETAASAVPAAGKVVVLDDDPTGTQTVHGIPVLTTWSREALAAELLLPERCVYLLTNTRALSREQACRINREVGQNLAAAARQTAHPFRVISRSDSTLRGHFPAEVNALAEGLGISFDATLIIPAFFAGGRFTVGDVHYVADGERLIPVGETEFARDSEFGFRSSNLREWVEEKTGGQRSAAEVHSLSLERIRCDGASAILDDLLSVPKGGMIVVNAAAISDLAVLTQALAEAEAQGRRYLFRSAAEFVPLYAGISPRPVLAASDLRSQVPGTGGGLIVVGSYVGKTSSQLDVLFSHHPEVAKIEADVRTLVNGDRRNAEVVRLRTEIQAQLRSGKTVVLFTSRVVLTGATAAEFGAIGRKVASALVEVVGELSIRPSWFVAKGGITSSDLASKSLGMRRAIVLGQALPGVPVWAPGSESKWPGLPYIVFPGNVGGPDALSALVSRLGQPPHAIQS
jgi:uncharacterized protein YgbK (DUF1537 family)